MDPISNDFTQDSQEIPQKTTRFFDYLAKPNQFTPSRTSYSAVQAKDLSIENKAENDSATPKVVGDKELNNLSGRSYHVGELIGDRFKQLTAQKISDFQSQQSETYRSTYIDKIELSNDIVGKDNGIVETAIQSLPYCLGSYSNWFREVVDEEPPIQESSLFPYKPNQQMSKPSRLLQHTYAHAAHVFFPIDKYVRSRFYVQLETVLEDPEEQRESISPYF